MLLGDDNNLENISPVGAIAAYYQNATVQTQLGPMLMRERLQRDREVIETSCCKREIDCLYMCLRCRKLCCWCFGGTSCIFCDSCTVELSNARERLNKLIDDVDDKGFNQSILAISRQELHDAFSETSVSTAEILSHSKRVESRLLKELAAVEAQLIEGYADPNDLP